MAERFYTRAELAGKIRKEAAGFTHKTDDEVLKEAFIKRPEMESWLVPAPEIKPPPTIKELATQAFEAAAPAGLSEALRYRNIQRPAAPTLPAGLSEAARAAVRAVGGQVKAVAEKPIQAVFPPPEKLTAVNEALNIRPAVEKYITKPVMRTLAPVGVESEGQELTKRQNIIGRTILETMNELIPMSPSEAAGWLIGPKITEVGIKGGLLALSKVAPKTALKMVEPITELGNIDTLFSKIKTAVEQKIGFRIPDSTWAPLQDDIARAILKKKMGISLKRTPAPAKTPTEPVNMSQRPETGMLILPQPAPGGATAAPGRAAGPIIIPAAAPAGAGGPLPWTEAIKAEITKGKAPVIPQLVEPAAAAPAQGKPAAKAPWQMTRAEFEKQVPITPLSKTEASNIIEGGMQFRFDVPTEIEDIVGFAHKRNIQRAIREGRPIPPKVMKEYMAAVKAEISGLRPPAAVSTGKEIWDMPAEQLQAKLLAGELLPPEKKWKTNKEIIADMKKYPREEAYRKWAAEGELRERGLKHRLPQEVIKKYGLQGELGTLKEMEAVVKADVAKDYLANRPGGVTPFKDAVVKMGYFNKSKVLRWLQVERGQDWKGKELPEEFAPYIRKGGVIGPGDLTDMLYFKGVIPENNPDLVIAGLAQDLKIARILKEGGDLSEALPKRDMAEYGSAYMLKKPKQPADLPGQIFIPGSEPAPLSLPDKKIEKEAGISPEEFKDNFTPENTPDLFTGKPSDLSGKSWGVEMPLEAIPGTKPIFKTEILNFAEKAFDVPITGRATIRMGEAVGKFFPTGRYIRLKTWGELEVVAHEVAHAIDQNLFNRHFTSFFTKPAVEELRNLDYNQSKRLIYEGFAEWFRHLMTTGQAEKLAPVFTQEFNAIIAGKQTEKDIEKIAGMFKRWQGQGALNRFKKQTDTHGETDPAAIKDKVMEAAREFYRDWVDKFDALKITETEAKIKPGVKLSPFEKATKYSNKSTAIAKQWIFDKAVDLDGNVIGMCLLDALRPAMKINPLGFVDKETFETFREYYIAKGVIERAARGIETGRDLTDAKFIVKKFANPAWDLAVKQRTEWEHNLANLLVGKYYTAKEMKVYLDAFQFHLSFRRTGKTQIGAAGAGSILKPGKAIYRATGSGRPLINPFESDITNTQKFIKIAMKADIAQTMADFAGDYPESYGQVLKPVSAPQKSIVFTAAKLKNYLVSEGIDITDLDMEKMVNIFQISTTGKGNIIPILLPNGKRKFFEVDEKFYKAINAVGPAQIGTLTKFLRPFAVVKRLGATGINIAFQVLRNPMKDWPTFAAYSKYTRNPFRMARDLITGSWQGATTHMPEWTGIKANEMARRWEAIGGEMSTFFGSNREGAFKAYDEMLLAGGGLASKALLVVKHPLSALMGILGTMEKGPRLAEFKGLYEMFTRQYPDWPEAVKTNRAFLGSLDVTTNFSRAGFKGREVNQNAAFFNANMQGGDKLAREIKSDPLKFFIIGFTLLTPPALMSWWKNKDKDFYNNLPYAYRYGNILVETPKAVIRIPSPFELGIIFQALPVALCDYAYRKNPAGFKGIGEMIFAQVPNPIWSAFGPLINVATDENYLGVPIEGKRLKRLPVSERINPDTMPIALGLSRAFEIFNIPVSPVQMDYLLNDWTGGFFRRTGFTGGGIKEPADWPVFGSVIVRSPEAPRRQIELFFSEMKKLQELKNADKETPAQAARLIKLEDAYTYNIKYKFQQIKKARDKGEMDVVAEKYQKMAERLNQLYK